MLEWLTEFRQTLNIYYIIKGIIKDTDEQPDEGIHRVKSGRGPSAGASVPMNWGKPPSWKVGISPTWKLSKTFNIGIFMAASSHRHDH